MYVYVSENVNVEKKEWRKEIGRKNRSKGEGEGGNFLGVLVEVEGRGQWWAGHHVSCKELGVLGGN